MKTKFCLWVTFVLTAVLLPVTTSMQSSSVVSNILPKVDTISNQILDIHDGNTLLIDNVFYWFGASYGYCQEMASGCESIQVGSCGFNLNHTVSLATSTDLVSWTLVGEILPLQNRPTGILFSPWVAKSASTGLYVLWVNILPVINGSGDFEKSFYSVYTSSTPTGPFVVANPNVTGLAYTALPDATSIFVDDDGSGYVAFTHEDTHINNVQELTPDLLGPKIQGGVSPQIGNTNNEGILMFKRDALYYIMFGQCCCFCGEGTNVEVHVSTSPLGPYNLTGQLIPSGSVWHGQTGSVWFTGVDWVLQGDRWQSAPDHIKAHDFSYLSPIRFTEFGGIESVTAFETNVTISY
jgi:hypothetical protein